jgi:hypothetical protein
VFKIPSDVSEDFVIDGLDREVVADLIKRFSATDSTVLELAATAHWLAVVEKIGDWRSEIRLRKGIKTENGRLERAVDLLRELKLRPAAEVGLEAL